MDTTKAMIPSHTIEAMCRAYADAQRDVAEAFRLLDVAKKRLDGVFAAGSYGVSMLPHNISDSYLGSGAEETALNIRKLAWNYVLRQTRVLEMCGVKQREELVRQVSNGEDLPDLTEDNVWSLLNKLGDELPAMLEAALKEVFEFLTPSSKWTRYKTNNSFKVGKRVIVSYAFDTQYGCRLNYHKEPFIQALDNVFHLLDGKGVARYPDNLVTAIETALRKHEWCCETEYFKCKWFKVGTLHIDFQRLDLVDELNKRAGGGGLDKGQVADPLAWTA
jgi:hypothetical protein